MASVIVICNFDPAVTSLQEVLVCNRFHSRQTNLFRVSKCEHRFDICVAMPVLAGSHGSECFGAFMSQCHCIRQWAVLIGIFLYLEVIIVLMMVLSVFSHAFGRHGDCMNMIRTSLNGGMQVQLIQRALSEARRTTCA